VIVRGTTRDLLPAGGNNEDPVRGQRRRPHLFSLTIEMTAPLHQPCKSGIARAGEIGESIDDPLFGRGLCGNVELRAFSGWNDRIRQRSDRVRRASGSGWETTLNGRVDVSSGLR